MEPQLITGSTLKLDLGCGQTPRDGFTGVDLYAPNAIQIDLESFPWPWADGQVDELHSSHYLEHLDTVRVLHGGRRKDLLVAFMDEAWRVLRPGGVFRIVVPNARNSRAFQDPTHRRFFVAESFAYYSRAWRQSQGLDHGYLGDCDFSGEVVPSVDQVTNALHPEAQARIFSQAWNVIHDWHVLLTKQAAGRDARLDQGHLTSTAALVGL